MPFFKAYVYYDWFYKFLYVFIFKCMKIFISFDIFEKNILWKKWLLREKIEITWLSLHNMGKQIYSEINNNNYKSLSKLG